MRDTDYAYCVARIRANERYLLKEKDLSELLECKSFDSAIDYLISKKLIKKNGFHDCIVNKPSSDKRKNEWNFL